MKNNVSTITRSGDLGGEKHAMDFAPGANAHLVSVLTNLYSYTPIVREYSTNARDSHIEAGQTRPIEVRTPTGLRTTFEVQDWGTGMSSEEVWSVFGLYGASTKRESDAQTGILGLGSKSALSRTNQFTITSVKDGVKTTAVASLTEQNIGEMEIVSTVPTDEGNGTLISIPVGGDNTLHRLAEDLFQFWPKGTVLLNGEEPSKVDELTKLMDGVYLQSRTSRDAHDDIIVMGGVSYPCTTKLFDDNGRYYGRSYRIIVFAPMGAVNFVPSREALWQTDLTKKFIAEISKTVTQGMNKFMADSIEACASGWDALLKLHEFDDMFSLRNQSFTYKGQVVPKVIALPTTAMYYQKGYKSQWSEYDKDHKLYVASLVKGKLHVITNAPFTGASANWTNKSAVLSSYNKSRFSAWAKANGIDRAIILSGSALDPFWYDGFIYQDWDTIKLPATRVAKDPKLVVPKPKGSYQLEAWYMDDIRDPISGEVTATRLHKSANYDAAKQLPKSKCFYITKQEWKKMAAAMENFLRKYPEYCCVVIGGNQTKKFTRLHPNAQPFADVALAMETRLRERADKVKDQYIINTHDMRQVLGCLDKNRITEPDLLALFDEDSRVVVPIEIREYNEFYALFTGAKSRLGISWYNYQPTARAAILFERWPLLRAFIDDCYTLRRALNDEMFSADLYDYLNATLYTGD